MSATDPVSAIVLAGGRARRLGGVDKGLLDLAGKPLIAHVLGCIEPQVDEAVISANRHADRYADFGWPVIPDASVDFPGPLAGVVAGARLACHDWLLVVPCDTPFLPDNLAARMLECAHADGVRLVRAADAGRTHYAIMLVRRDLLDDLIAWLATGERRIQDWQARHRCGEVRFMQPPWAFLNINSVEDLRQAEAILAA